MEPTKTKKKSLRQKTADFCLSTELHRLHDYGYEYLLYILLYKCAHVNAEYRYLCAGIVLYYAATATIKETPQHPHSSHNILILQ